MSSTPVSSLPAESISQSLIPAARRTEDEDIRAAVGQVLEAQKQIHTIRDRLSPVTSAFHDSLRAPNGCAPGTCIAPLARIHDWFHDESTTALAVLWLNGFVGSGKSTIAKTVADRANQDDRLAASFFFSALDTQRRNFAAVVPTIVYQIATWNERLRVLIYRAVIQYPEISQATVTKQIDVLLTRALGGTEHLGVTGLLVLDALDECAKENGIDGSSLLRLLVDSLAKLPFCLKILVTSHPVHSLRTIFNNCIPHDAFALHEMDQEKDVALYLSQQLADISHKRMDGIAWPEKDKLEALTNQVGSLFAFASSAVKDISGFRSLPKHRLNNILTGNEQSRTRLLSNMDGRYKWALRHLNEGDTQSDESWVLIRDILSIILFSQTSPSIIALCSLLGRARVEIEDTLGRFGSVLAVPSKAGDPIRIVHPSFVGYLSDEKRCRDVRYAINEHTAHVYISRRCFEVMRSRMGSTSGHLHELSHGQQLTYAHSHWLAHVMHTLGSQPHVPESHDLVDSPDAYCLAYLNHFLSSTMVDRRTIRFGASDKLSQVRRDSHVVVLCLGRNHGSALIIPRLGLEGYLVRLPRLKEQLLVEVVQSTGQPIERGESSWRLSMGVTKGATATAGIFSKLWQAVVKPVIFVLGLQPSAIARDRPRIHWCPTGQLGVLPLHAAGLHGRGQNMRLGDCLADYAVSSYTPSLDALLTLQDAPQTWRTSDLRSCVLAEPHPTAYLHMSPLPAVGKEAAIVADQLLRAEVQDATLTRSAAEALAALKTAHLFHFAGHGQWSRGDVLGSEFILRGRNLSVSEVIDAFPTNPVLAYLSQCSSTSGPTLGPAAAMLFCGFKSIVSTMWAMPDRHGPRVAYKFYESLFSRRSFSLQDVSYALEDAICDLRKLGVPPIEWGVFIHVGA